MMQFLRLFAYQRIHRSDANAESNEELEKSAFIHSNPRSSMSNSVVVVQSPCFFIGQNLMPWSFHQQLGAFVNQTLLQAEFDAVVLSSVNHQRYMLFVKWLSSYPLV